jgi:hypothetical protein
VGQSKLILVEGVPGSGKTTMAEFCHRWLDQNGIRNRLYSEGDPAHPADFESVAYFTEAEYSEWLLRHPDQREMWARYSDAVDGDRFIYYGQLARESVPDALIAELAQRDVYELEEIETHERLLQERWRRFVTSARQRDEVSVFECCFLQNPLTVTLLKHNVPPPDALAYVQTLQDLIRPLDPVLIYLSHREIQASLKRAAQERPPQWRERVGAYTDRGAWARATGHTGFEGFVTWLEIRQSLALSFVARSGLAHLVIDVTGQEWSAYQRRVAAFLAEALLGKT